MSPPVLKTQIWWSNIAFFLGTHLTACIGTYYWSIYAVPRATLWLAFASWQLSCFGITIGYHRLYSHKSFRASLGLRTALAALGTAAHQGSIRVRSCLRHRLHHRFTDDPIHDPYAATRGLFYSHVGWIFFKPNYGKLDLIETDDLDRDPVVRIQHRYYHLFAFFLGFLAPIGVASLWGDPFGGFIWGGLVARILGKLHIWVSLLSDSDLLMFSVWHCTFFVNSLAHWNGLQPYSDENTSRGNLADHAFPHDFRSGPSLTDWDPSKWAIIIFYYFGLATKLRRAEDEDIKAGLEHMRLKGHGIACPPDQDEVPVWNLQDLKAFMENGRHMLLLLDGYVVNATSYVREHPGGSKLIRNYSLRKQMIINEPINVWPDASNAFHGGMNIHSWAANQRMKKLRIAKLSN
ncbi:Acyl-CoA desaturase [Leucoagaricus sp. SymC.cos]|nr:Acyl-CoA desaturase [Leucoagaricus sp. SymC.cos]